MKLSSYTPYSSLKQWRNNNIATHQSSTDELHLFHEKVMKRTFEIALEQIINKLGQPPCKFSWFVMGSAGRCEQAVHSDQDHGLIFEHSNQNAKEYFQRLGEEISAGLHFIGYPYCDGDVMASNPRWCLSINEWKNQMNHWIKEDSWESIRFLLIFFDSRVIKGEENHLYQLKQLIYDAIRINPKLLIRMHDNTKYIEKGLGVFNQFITVRHGQFTGCINLKRTAFFPYVNAVRLLAIKENIQELSTLKRLDALSKLPEYRGRLLSFRDNFSKLLRIRLMNGKNSNYEDVHFLDVKKLDIDKKREFKYILREGKKLNKYAESIINRVVKHEK